MTVQEQLDALKAARDEAELLAKVTSLTAHDLNRNFSTMLKYQKDINRESRTLNQLKKQALDQERELTELRRRATPAQQAIIDQELDRVQQMKTYVDLNEKALNAMRKQLSASQALGNSLKDMAKTVDQKIATQLMAVPSYLLDAQKTVLQMNLALGASGEHAERLQNSLINAGSHAAKLGMSFKELAQMQEAYVDATGKLVGLSARELKSVTDIAKGTALGAEGAAEMAAHYDMIGYTGDRVAENIEGIVNKSEKLGLSSKGILKDINKNWTLAQKFTFQNGVKGLEKMAIQAKQIKISMEDTFAAADKARTLEGSLEMASRLMVMGGKFAQTDPFQLSFLARNKPEEFQKKLGDMTKGVARFNKATGEFEVSALDLDRLREVGAATGIEFEKLKEAALNASRIDMAKGQIFAGTAEDRELVARMAKMGKNGKFTIEVGGNTVDISKLNGEQVQLLKQQSKTLEDRARDSQAFDETWKNFIEEMKATALPLVKELNTFTGYFRGFLDKFRDSTGSLAPLAKTLLGVFLAYKALHAAGAVGSAISGVAGGLGSLKSMFGGGGGSSASAAPSGGGSGSGGGLGGMLGGASAGTVAAIGLAAVGLGYGLKLAAEGFSQLATSMSKLTGSQVAGLTVSIIALSAGFAGFGIAMASIGANPASWAGVALVAAVGASMVGMGYGIKLATDGVANMVTSFGSMASVDFSAFNQAMGNATEFLSADNTNIASMQAMLGLLSATENKVMDEIKSLLSKPLQMELAGGSKLNFTIDITNTIDGDMLASKVSKRFAIDLKKKADGKA